MAKITTAIKGNVQLIPAYYCSPKGDMWCKAEIHKDGIVIALNSVEKNNGGLFIGKDTMVKLLAALNKKEVVSLEVDK